MTSQSREARPFDIVLWGATGFTGQLTAEELTRRYGVDRGLTWAIAGRSKAKLEETRNALVRIDPAAKDLAIVLGDANDAASLRKLASSTRVVVTTVGPYALHGKELVAACVEEGTDYCDLTGEAPFVREMIDKHHARAEETGARIVHCCGFDSIPSDLGVLMLETYAKEKLGRACDKVKMFVVGAKGGVSGGTVASGIGMFEEASRDRAYRRLMNDPYSLDPKLTGTLKKGDPRSQEMRDGQPVRFDRDAGRWTAPFVMAAINTRIVRRTNALLGYPWGEGFVYAEAMSFPKGPRGLVSAATMTAGLGAFMGAVSVAPLRKLLTERVLPSPGQGPSKKVRDNGRFLIRFVGHAGSDVLRAEVGDHKDPGYGSTARMLSEAAVSLARDPKLTGGGVLTPGYALGMPYIERARAMGMTFKVEGAS